MQIINLYKYTRADGGTTVSPAQPECDYTPIYRVVADEGHCVTKDGTNVYSCADVDDPDGWYEVLDLGEELFEEE